MNKFSASSFIQFHLQHRKSGKTLLYLIHSKAKKLKVYLQVYKKNNIGITQWPQYWVRLRKQNGRKYLELPGRKITVTPYSTSQISNWSEWTNEKCWFRSKQQEMVQGIRKSVYPNSICIFILGSLKWSEREAHTLRRKRRQRMG